MLLAPVFKDYLWGGERLVAEYGKETDLRPVAESWELSCHPDGLSIVCNGAYAGQELASVLAERPEWVVGTNVSADADADVDADVFPILIKLIDAKQDLSLQVHPGDAYAREHENGLGKNEAWYVIDCEPGARLILGLKDGTPTDKIPQMIKDGSIIDYANYERVMPGDCFSVPAGLLHAIGGGVLVAEVQQSSNVTYRVHDYGRLGADGKPRQLHTRQAAEVVDGALRARCVRTGATAPYEAACRVTALTDWQYFKLLCVDVDGSAQFDCGDTFHALLSIEGDFTIVSSTSQPDHRKPEPTTAILKKGACAYMPRGLGKYSINGKGRLLLAKII